MGLARFLLGSDRPRGTSPVLATAILHGASCEGGQRPKHSLEYETASLRSR